MDALELIKERNRMCHYYNDDPLYRPYKCMECLLHEYDAGCNTVDGITEDYIAIVEQWSSEHPRKTLKDAFLEKYPKAPLVYGVPNVNPCCLDGDFDSPLCGLNQCAQCRNDFWMQEVE